MKYGDPNLQQYEESKLEQKQSESKKFTLTTTFARKKKKKKKELIQRQKNCRRPIQFHDYCYRAKKKLMK